MAAKPSPNGAFISATTHRLARVYGPQWLKKFAGASAGELKGIRLRAQVLEKLMRDDKATIDQLHRRVAQKVTLAVLEAYDKTVEADTNPFYALRRNRMKLGVLRELIATDVCYGDAEGVHFMSAERWAAGADVVAKQWARLSYGAGDAGKPYHGTYQMIFFERVVFTEHSTAQARPAFEIPAGIWRDAEGKPVIGGKKPAEGGGRDAFFPGRMAGLRGSMRSLEWTPTKGIVARNFLEVGLEVLAIELPLAYEELIKEWLKKFEVKP